MRCFYAHADLFPARLHAVFLPLNLSAEADWVTHICLCHSMRYAILYFTRSAEP